MKPLSKVAPGLLDIQIQIQAVWIKIKFTLNLFSSLPLKYVCTHEYKY